MQRFCKSGSQLSTSVFMNSNVEAFTICGEHFSVDGCQLSDDILHNMFRKAEKLVASPNSICPSPGSATAKLVEIESEQKPHFVTKKANNRYCCDTDCPMWKCAKICFHTIACAYQDKCLHDFLSKVTETPIFMHSINVVYLLMQVKRPINIKHAQSLQQKHCQVCKKKYSHVLPILVFQLLR